MNAQLSYFVHLDEAAGKVVCFTVETLGANAPTVPLLGGSVGLMPYDVKDPIAAIEYAASINKRYPNLEWDTTAWEDSHAWGEIFQEWVHS